MLSLLRSSAPCLLALTALALSSTGCAGKLHGSARLSMPSPSVAVSVPSSSVTVQGSGNGSAWSQYQASAQYQADAQAQANAQTQVQYGGCGPVTPPAPPPPRAEPWRPAPVFYGVPLENAQDVVFVLDRSSSMTEVDSGAPIGFINPTATLSTITAMGASAAASLSFPTSPSALGSRAAAFPGLVIPGFTTQQSKLDLAKAELTGAIAGLPDGTRYNVVFFGDSVASLSPALVTLNAVTRIGSMVFVQSIAGEGSTAAVPALRAAYASHPRRVVFLSDGLANVGGDGSQLHAEARQQMLRGVRFDTVGVGADQDRSLMHDLAAESGGIASSR